MSWVEVRAIPGLEIETWGTHFRTGSSGQRPSYHGQLTARPGVLAIIDYVNATRPDLSKMPDRRSLALDGRTWAEVSLPALRENFRVVQEHVGPNVAICAVVKADGYGTVQPNARSRSKPKARRGLA